MNISDRAAIRQLAGEHHDLVDHIDYEEDRREYPDDPVTRDYDVTIKQTVVVGGLVRTIYCVSIELGGDPEVRVNVHGLRSLPPFGSFTLSSDEYPSPIWLDPAAVSRALTEIILPVLREYFPQARLPEA